MMGRAEDKHPFAVRMQRKEDDPRGSLSRRSTDPRHEEAGAQPEHYALAGSGIRSTSIVRMIDVRTTHISVVSMHLYAQAAAGPE